MNDWIIYLIKVNLSLLFLYAFYLIFLKKETSFHFNRAYLLVGLGLALAVPLLHIRLPKKSLPTSVAKLPWQPLYALDQELTQPTLRSKTTAPKNVVNQPEPNSRKTSDLQAVKASQTNLWASINWWQALAGLYLVGASIFLALFIYRFVHIISAIVRAKVMPQDHYKVVYTYGKLPMLSFFNYLFWDNTLKLTPEQRAQIIAHEVAHIKQYHTIDVLLMELFCVVFWYNPVIYWWRSALRENHEFVADKAVIQQQDAHSYAMLLLSQSLGSVPQFTLGNRLVQSQIKKRVNMMTKKTMNRKIYWKYALLVPMLACLSLGFGQVSFGQSVALSSSSLVAHQLAASKSVKVVTPSTENQQDQVTLQKALIKEAIQQKIAEEFALLTPVLDSPDKEKPKMRRLNKRKINPKHQYKKFNSNDEYVEMEANIDGTNYDVRFDKQGKVKRLFVDGKKIKPSKFKKYRKTTNEMWGDWLELKDGLKDLSVLLKNMSKDLNRTLKKAIGEIDIDLGGLIDGLVPVIDFSLDTTSEVLKNLKIEMKDLKKDLKVDMKEFKKELKKALKEIKNIKIDFDDDDNDD